MSFDKQKNISILFSTIGKKGNKIFFSSFFSYCIEIIGNGFLYHEKSPSYIPKYY